MARRQVDFTEGAEHSSGKTKVNYQALENNDALVLKAKDDITAKDNPELTRIMPGKGVWANETTCAVFDLFADAGLPVAYLGRVSERSFAARKAIMLPFEMLGRREVPKGSSFLSRNPQLVSEDGSPHRFSRLLVEFCLKTTHGGYVTPDGQVIVKDLDALTGEEDPIIKDPRAKSWVLTHSKKPKWDDKFILRNLDEENVQRILQNILMKTGLTQDQLIAEVERLTILGYLLLEGAFKKLGGKLQDIKFEFGICLIDGKWTIVFADVIDCDSWRLLINGQQYSKQIFRDFGEAGLAESAEKYAYIAKLVQQFGIPKQALVVWLGSENDPRPDLSFLTKELPTLDIVFVIGSGHKETIRSLKKVHNITANYPQGGLFVCMIGRSNGAGPTFSTHTDWPVMSCPVSMKDFPEDLFSNVRMPSEAPHMTIWPPENIVPVVLGQLSASNPAAYMLRRKRVEELDDSVM